MDPRAIERIGPYLVRRFVAEGGMAWVFEVVDPKFEGRRLALKMLKPEAAIGEEFERFKSEAGLLAEIDHPNLVTVFDAGRDEATGWLYYTMTFVDGGTLANVLAERGALPLDEVGHVVLNLLDGLAELHRHGIIHRDVKPQNLMIGSDGRVRLADLGIARRERSSRHTRTGYAVGTVAYMAPEQARGNRELTPASDVFSAGLTLYETLTGRSVYEGVEGVDSSSSNEVLGYLVALARTGEEIDITYPPEVDLPAGVRKVIERACRLDPQKRFPDAGAMRVALEQALEAPPSAPLQLGRLPLLAAGGLALLLAIGAASWILTRTDPSLPAQQSLERATALRSEVGELAERAKDLVPPPPKAWIRAVDRALEKAEDRLTDARADLAAKSFEAARANGERAVSGFDAVCSELGGKTLAERAQRTADEASRQAALLREAGAPRLLPEEWKKLEDALNALAAAATGAPCALARAQLDRIEQGDRLRRDALRLQDGLKDQLPRLARRAADEARKALQLARAETSDAAEYREALRQGEAKLAEGRKREAAKEFTAARASYQTARERFDMAAALLPAAKARAKVRRLERAGSLQPGPVSLMVARCDSDWRDQKWGDAAKSCEEAADAMEAVAEEGERAKGLELARTEARAARDAARSGGAELSARALWDEAEKLLATAESEREKGRHAEASRAFERAGERFAEGQKKAIELLAETRENAEEARRALSKLGACGSLEAETARDHCQQARSDLALASEAIESRNAVDAARILSTANVAIEQAGRAEAVFQGAKPQPPELVSRTPKREVVETAKDRTLAFAIEARDRNGDRLRYAWSFEGQPIAGSGGDRIEVQASRSGRVSVTVDDGRGGRLTESWSIELKNRPPQLTVTPKEDALTLRPGDKRSFQIRARDPDGDAVKELQTRLGGKTVATGERYEFTAKSPGSYSLEFVALDAAGARSVTKKRITVEATTTGTDLAGPETSKASPRPPAPPDDEPWKAGVQAALDRYEGCLERKDLPCVKDVWPQLNQDMMFWKAYEMRLKGAGPVQIDIDVRSMTHKTTQQGETVITEIEQTDSFPPAPSKKRRFRSVLMKRKTTNDWQFIDHKIEG